MRLKCSNEALQLPMYQALRKTVEAGTTYRRVPITGR